jgi:hypothetical protein
MVEGGFLEVIMLASRALQHCPQRGKGSSSISRLIADSPMVGFSMAKFILLAICVNAPITPELCANAVLGNLKGLPSLSFFYLFDRCCNGGPRRHARKSHQTLPKPSLARTAQWGAAYR